MNVKKEPKVTIIVLNLNQNQYTLDAINSILGSCYKNFYLLLIDNGSTEKNVSGLKQALPQDSRLVFHHINTNRGYVGGVNFGLKKAKEYNPDYYLIINNDIIIDKFAIKELITASIRNNDNAIVTGKAYDFGTSIIQYIGDELTDSRYLKYNRIGAGENDDGQYDSDSFRDMIDDIYWLLPKRIFNDVGYYSTLFWFNGESADYALRATYMGYKLLYAHRAKIWHKGSITIGGRDKNPTKSFWIIQSKTLLRERHLSNFYFILFILKLFYEILYSYIVAIFRFFAGNSKAMLLANSKLKGVLSCYKILKEKKNYGYNPFLKGK